MRHRKNCATLCASPGGGCQFLGTAATSQVVGEALGLSLPHSALSPSGEPVWYELGIRSARALEAMRKGKLSTRQILTPGALRNAMIVHAACGGSSNLILHLTAIAYHAGLKRPKVDDWDEVNKLVPRLVDVLPNGPRNHTTAQFFLAGGVPELMLKLRDLDLLVLDAMTCTGNPLGRNLEDWEGSSRRSRFREILAEQDEVNPDDAIMDLSDRQGEGLDQYGLFPAGKLGSGRLGCEKHLDRPFGRGQGWSLPNDGPGPSISFGKGSHAGAQRPERPVDQARRRNRPV